MRDMRVTLVTCVWQRRALTRAFWLWCAWLKARWALQGIALELVTAASEPDDAALAGEHGASVVMHENKPLGAKFNAALAHARETEPDWVLIMGSDDFFCPVIADTIGDALQRGESVGPQDLYFGDAATGRVRYWRGYRIQSRTDEPAGCGVTHSRSLLEATNWKLWADGWHHGMDHSRFWLLRRHKAMPTLFNVRTLGGVMIDVKTQGVNLWPFDRTIKQPCLRPETWPGIWGALPAEVVAALPLPEVPAGAVA